MRDCVVAWLRGCVVACVRIASFGIRFSRRAAVLGKVGAAFREVLGSAASSCAASASSVCTFRLVVARYVAALASRRCAAAAAAGCSSGGGAECADRRELLGSSLELLLKAFAARFDSIESPCRMAGDLLSSRIGCSRSHSQLRSAWQWARSSVSSANDEALPVQCPIVGWISGVCGELVASRHL